MVRKVDSGHFDGLQESDIILTLNGKLVTRVSDLDVQYDNEWLDAVVVRKLEEVHVKVPTVPTEDLETSRVVIFCGAVLHRPHHAVRQQISKVHSDVYISSRVSHDIPFSMCSWLILFPQMTGSPAYMYGLAPTNFITHVNGKPTPDLDSFLAESSKIPNNTYFRLKVITFDNVPWVVTMKKNEHYFPTVEYIKDANAENGLGWRKEVHESDTKDLGMLGEEALPDAVRAEGEVNDEAEAEGQ